MTDKIPEVNVLLPTLETALADDTLPLGIRAGEEQGSTIVFDAHEYSPLEFTESLRWRTLQQPLIEHREVELARRVKAAGRRRLVVGEDARAGDDLAMLKLAHQQMPAVRIILVVVDAAVLQVELPNLVRARHRDEDRVGRPFVGRAGQLLDKMLASIALEQAASVMRELSAHDIEFAFRNGKLDLNGLIDALDDEGLISILAEPNLTALSGETASFLAGGEFPIPVSQGEDGITVEYKEYGVALDRKSVV